MLQSILAFGSGSSADRYQGWVGHTPRFACWNEEELAAVGLKIAALVAKSFSGRITSFP